MPDAFVALSVGDCTSASLPAKHKGKRALLGIFIGTRNTLGVVRRKGVCQIDVLSY